VAAGPGRRSRWGGAALPVRDTDRRAADPWARPGPRPGPGPAAGSWTVSAWERAAIRGAGWGHRAGLRLLPGRARAVRNAPARPRARPAVRAACARRWHGHVPAAPGRYRRAPARPPGPPRPGRSAAAGRPPGWPARPRPAAGRAEG